jgi:AcrR family transcriptional regulator
MPDETSQNCDPRIRRTRELLHQALAKLLKSKDFEDISVQEIADAAQLNRATFYDHYTDKSALLECLVAAQFQEMLEKRRLRFESGCAAELKAVVLAVCDYISRTGRARGKRQPEPHMESAVIAVLLQNFANGLSTHKSNPDVPVEVAAAAISWAIYGAAREWALAPRRYPVEKVAETVVTLVSPMLAALQPPSATSGEALHYNGNHRGSPG